jgi:hypothetical protein
MFGHDLNCLIKEAVRGLFVTAAISPSTTTTFCSSDDPQLVIG